MIVWCHRLFLRRMELSPLSPFKIIYNIVCTVFRTGLTIGGGGGGSFLEI